MNNKKDEVCPKCGSPLGEITETKTGKKLQRCSKGSWDPEEKKNIGCDYVKWLEVPPTELNEKCPKCGHVGIVCTAQGDAECPECKARIKIELNF